jgi:protein tyrosine phosphatase (PTP) superfamily phosphohydrolase (DUF442 family)
MRKIVVGAIAVAAIALGAFVLWRWGTGNFGVVVAGRVFRAGQMSPDQLVRTIREYHVHTVLNLRGCNPGQPWYTAERRAVLDAGVTHIDMSLASDQWVSRAQAKAVLDTLGSCSYPVLIHCEWGAERTGLLSAFVELDRAGGSPESARRQFSPWYLFLPTKHGLVMRSHVDAYRAWLRSQGRTHSPDQFHKWILQDYRPGSPSREEWPYDPYPLVVVTRPAAPAVKLVRTGSAAGRSQPKPMQKPPHMPVLR